MIDEVHQYLPPYLNSELTMSQAIKNYFRWKEKSVGIANNNPWVAPLHALHTPTTITPRTTTGWQVYQCENRERVNKEYTACTDEPRGGIALRNQIAREQYSVLGSSEQKRLQHAAKEEYKRKLQEHEQSLAGQPVTDPEAQRE